MISKCESLKSLFLITLEKAALFARVLSAVNAVVLIGFYSETQKFMIESNEYSISFLINEKPMGSVYMEMHDNPDSLLRGPSDSLSSLKCEPHSE